MNIKYSVAVACFLPGRAKDLSAPPVVKGTKVGRFRWLGHVFGMQELDPCRQITVLKPEDTRRVGKAHEVAEIQLKKI